MPKSTLENGVRAFQQGTLSEVGKSQRPLTELEMELAQVKRELAQVKMERNFNLNPVFYAQLVTGRFFSLEVTGGFVTHLRLEDSSVAFI